MEQLAVTDIEKKIYKHAATIHCSGELSLFQRKIINCLLYNAHPTLNKENRFQIKIRELLNLMGLSNNDYQYLRNAFRDIRRTDISWNLTEEQFKDNAEKTEFEKWIDCSWLSWAMSDGSTIYYEFPAPLKTYLSEPSVYASMSLAMQRHFTSKFALILYENCIRYAHIGKTRSFTLETFRKIMGVTDSQYMEFRSFNSRVIRPAQKQVNELTDITVEPIYKRSNRKVSSIQFKVIKKAKILSKTATKDLVKSLTEGNNKQADFISFRACFKEIAIKDQEKRINDYLKHLKKEQKKNPENFYLISQLEQYEIYGWDCRVFMEGMFQFYQKENI